MDSNILQNIGNYQISLNVDKAFQKAVLYIVGAKISPLVRSGLFEMELVLSVIHELVATEHESLTREDVSYYAMCFLNI